MFRRYLVIGIFKENQEDISYVIGKYQLFQVYYLWSIYSNKTFRKF